MNTRPVTEAQLTANRANVSLSSGPKTEEGKQISSRNASKTGLTGRSVLLASDELAVYEGHCSRVIADHKPATSEERAHVDTIADLEWRLLCIPALESGIYALGRRRFADQFEKEPAESRAALLNSQIFLAYQKDLKNLYLQESRIVSRLAKELTKLEALQQQRLALEKSQLQEAAAYYRDCIERNIPYDHGILAEIGFEFSIIDVQRALANRQARETRSAWPAIDTLQAVKALQATKSA